MAIRIGLPRGLLYFQYGTQWKNFFQQLGAEVVVSSETSKMTLNRGCRLDGVCLPVKVFFGHVCELCGQVDYLFIPRIISVASRQYTCPEIIGIPDLIRSNLSPLPAVLDVSIDLRRNKVSLYQAIIQIGSALGYGRSASLLAWCLACRQRQRSPLHVPLADNKQCRIGLIGHPYVIYDRLISMDIIDRLRNSGTEVITPQMVNTAQAAEMSKEVGKEIFWSGGCHLAGAAFWLMQQPRTVDGIVIMTSFACGQDTLVGEVISRRAKVLGVPCMLLSVDEHTAEAGLVTRVEAFTDMLLRRNL
ncbi:acyl-CoA dehydratase activase-related protein [Propionispora sp. 2/2-37]|uniref:acyl-CoA dehydratase activase-related protein n=1 Tax=Propionispora sp. 2/2-37 TaxID=1677858 RepID=UPI0006BB6801|nr:acyl-CoA dehydratase activase-related protein [Propionispora sp. 2/2-37]